MDHKQTIRYGLNAALVIATCVAGLTATASAQEKPKGEKVGAEAPAKVERGGRDPFRRYEVVRKPLKMGPTKLEPPAIQVRIERYRAQKQTAAIAHVAPPKPTTALLLNEMQVIGIFRTPRGWAAMVEATPIKLSYVVYPGEVFFDGQLVAIEETRLVLRRDIVWNDGKRERAVEIKPLRAPSPIQAMTATKTAPTADSAEAEKPVDPKKP